MTSWFVSGHYIFPPLDSSFFRSPVPHLPLDKPLEVCYHVPMVNEVTARSTQKEEELEATATIGGQFTNIKISGDADGFDRALAESSIEVHSHPTKNRWAVLNSKSEGLVDLLKIIYGEDEVEVIDDRDDIRQLQGDSRMAVALSHLSSPGMLTYKGR